MNISGNLAAFQAYTAVFRKPTVLYSVLAGATPTLNLHVAEDGSGVVWSGFISSPALIVFFTEADLLAVFPDAVKVAQIS